MSKLLNILISIAYFIHFAGKPLGRPKTVTDSNRADKTHKDKKTIACVSR